MNYNTLLEKAKKKVEGIEVSEERQEIIWEIMFDLTKEEILEILISLPNLLSMKYWPPEGESTSIKDILIQQISKRLEWAIEDIT